jgi:alpha-mannosidase
MKFNRLHISLLAVLCLLIYPAYGQQKHLYIANDQHTDYFWIADAATYRLTFIKQLDYNCSNSLWVYEYEKAKTAGDFQRLINQIKSGHISVPYNPLVPLYGGQNAEIALRGMYYAGYLERKYGINIDLVIPMENQILPLGINSLWAGAGALYSYKGVCNCACPNLDFQNRKYEMYYSRGRDGKGVLMKWYDFMAIYQLGGYAESHTPAEAIVELNAKCNTAKYPYSIGGAFGYGADDLENYVNSFPAVAQAQSNSAQQVIVSNEEDFFKDFESQYSNAIPSQTVSFGNDWDLLVASMAKVSGDIKRSAEKLRTAEALASLVALQDTGFAQDLSSQRELAWISLGKYYDHDWTADGPASAGRAQFQRDMEHNFSGYVNTLYASAETALGNQIQKTGTNTRFYVFNQLSWNRDDVADFPYSGSISVKVIDVSTQLEVPSQVVSLNGVQYLRIFAPNIPSIGYKVFEIQPGLSAILPDAATFVNGVFENDYYKLTISENGSITSLQDKSDGNYEYTGISALNDFGIGSLSTGSYTVENAGPVSVTLNCTSDSPYTHTNRFTLYKSVERVDIDDELNQDIQNTTVTYRFPLNLDNTTVWHEEVGAVINAKLASNGGHYSDQNARYDWLTANHFVHVGNPTRGMTISNLGTHFFKLGNSTTFTLDENSSSVQFLAAGRVAYGTLGISNQGGDQSFQYQFALQPKTGEFNQTASMKMSLEHQNPLATGSVNGGIIYPGSAYSLMSINPQDVLLWSLKPAEEGAAKGLIARVWNQSNNTSFTLHGNSAVLSAKNTSHVETDLSDANVLNDNLVENIGSQEMKTFRIFLDSIGLNTNDTSDSAHRPKIFVYANPTSDIINILGNHMPNGRCRFSLTTILGQTLFQDQVIITDAKIERQISLKGLASGMYFLEIGSDKTKQVFKIIKN